MCDHEGCKKRAVVNVQTGVIVWNIDANGDYSENPVDILPDDDTNNHWCEDHEDELHD